MAIPKVPRFLVRFHEKSAEDKTKFREIFNWLTEHVKGQWASEMTIVHEIGTTLGERNYDCGYKIIYVNDPNVLMMFRLTFGDSLLPYKTHKRHIHPLMAHALGGKEIEVHEGKA